jgi:hypothetical protein
VEKRLNIVGVILEKDQNTSRPIKDTRKKSPRRQLKNTRKNPLGKEKLVEMCKYCIQYYIRIYIILNYGSRNP